MQRSDGLFSALADVSRRDFMKLCTALAATMGLSSKAGAEMTAALTEPKRPPVLWKICFSRRWFYSGERRRRLLYGRR